MRQVVRKNGMLVIDDNGKIIEPIAYMTYANKQGDHKGFYKAGYELFSVNVFTGDYPTNEEKGLKCSFEDCVWVAEDKFDFSILDTNLKILEDACNGKNFKVLFRLNINMPRWWREKYSEEITLFDNGDILMQSVFSKQWRKDVKVLFEKLHEYIQNSEYKDCVIAWQIAAMHTEEWIAPWIDGICDDFSKPAITAFKEYCQNKYKTIEELNKSWEENLNSFDDVWIPSFKDRELRYDKTQKEGLRVRVRDYFHFFNNGYADAIIYFCKLVKEVTNNTYLVGAFYGYIAQLNCAQGHSAISKVIDCPYIDYFASPFVYDEARGPAIDWFYHTPMNSVDKAGKLWFLETDVRTNLTKALYNSIPWVFTETIDPYYDNHPVWFGPKTRRDTINNITRVFSKIFISRNAFWWFDMWGGWFKDQEYMDLLTKMRALYKKEAQNEIKSASEIAVVLDENSSYYYSGIEMRSGCYGQLQQLGLFGAPYDIYLLDKFDSETAKKYKMILFSAPVSLSDEQIELAKKMNADGKVVLALCDVDGKYEFGLKAGLERPQLKEYADKAGVHVYSYGNVVYANKKFVSVTAHEKGKVELAMPFDCKLKLFNSDEVYTTTNKKIVLELEKNDTRFFEIVK